VCLCFYAQVSKKWFSAIVIQAIDSCALTLIPCSRTQVSCLFSIIDWHPGNRVSGFRLLALMIVNIEECHLRNTVKYIKQIVMQTMKIWIERRKVRKL
jgi:hypothetical protein